MQHGMTRSGAIDSQLVNLANYFLGPSKKEVVFLVHTLEQRWP